MFTIEGTEVQVVRKLEDGYLAKLVYSYNGYEDEDELEAICDQIVFYDNLYENPPTEKYAKEIGVLIKERDALSEEIGKLQRIKNDEKSTLNKINNYPFVKRLVDYLTGNFAYHLDYDRYEVSDKDRVFHDSRIKIVNFKDGGWQFYRMRSEHSDSYDDRPFMVFSTMEEVLEHSRERLIVRVRQYKNNEYWSSKSLKEEHEKIHYKNPVKEDAEYLAAYNEVYAFLVDREKKKEADKLKKEIEEFEAKKKKLETIEIESKN